MDVVYSILQSKLTHLVNCYYTRLLDQPPHQRMAEQSIPWGKIYALRNENKQGTQLCKYTYRESLDATASHFLDGVCLLAPSAKKRSVGATARLTWLHLTTEQGKSERVAVGGTKGIRILCMQPTERRQTLYVGHRARHAPKAHARRRA